jgi:2-polyprenyl-3-methyl-5-hydroxy-6-metoxy-1,4-benzoquinol methylase
VTSKSAVTKYYDKFIKEQYEIGVNDRIFLMYEKLQEHGLKPDSKVIELGCGIGVVTHLIRKIVTKGLIESIDLSPESIEFAKEKITNKNIEFYSGDVTEYQPKLRQADFVTLFDVIEHIPMDLHEKLFLNVANMLSEDGLLLINIPSPASINWDSVNAPEVLQIIDQPIPLSLITKNCDNAGLEVIKFESHSIWMEDDYHFMVIRKKKEYTNREVQLSTAQKAKRKIWRTKFEQLFKY